MKKVTCIFRYVIPFLISWDSFIIVLKSDRKPTGQKIRSFFQISLPVSIPASLFYLISVCLYPYISICLLSTLYFSVPFCRSPHFPFVEQLFSLCSLNASLSLRLCLAICLSVCLSAVSHILSLSFSLPLPFIISLPILCQSLLSLYVFIQLTLPISLCLSPYLSQINRKRVRELRIEKRYCKFEKGRDRDIERKRGREKWRVGRGTERHEGKEIEKCHRKFKQW